MDTKAARDKYREEVVREARQKIADGIELTMIGLGMAEIQEEMRKRAQMRLKLARAKSKNFLRLIK